MCLSPKAPSLPSPPPPPAEPPKPMISPEEAAMRSSSSTGGIRKSTSRSKLRLDVGGTGGTGSGLFLPEN